MLPALRDCRIEFRCLIPLSQPSWYACPICGEKVTAARRRDPQTGRNWTGYGSTWPSRLARKAAAECRWSERESDCNTALARCDKSRVSTSPENVNPRGSLRGTQGLISLEHFVLQRITLEPLMLTKDQEDG